ncbi:phage antirepressor KilAC domain-containing protein [Enterobacter hormaechei]|uniref:phage antirepressor KilAC domain-containing protein n=1 Tax=Enterobacter hormaechei TaxID=158836 RepID=UPI0009499FB9|nr:phage antirepressor KilAC domain-containing protein [Enterobacter hormaechei]
MKLSSVAIMARLADFSSDEGVSWPSIATIARQIGAGESTVRTAISQLEKDGCPEFTARLVDRWQELESGAGMVVPKTLPEALRLAADLAEQKQRLSEELAIAAPKVEFVDRYVKATGSMTFRQVAKLLNAKEPEFAMFLIENGIMYRLNRVLTPKSKHIEAGRFEVKTGTTNQTNYAFNQSRFTAKGVRWIGGLWAEYVAKGQIA